MYSHSWLCGSHVAKNNLSEFYAMVNFVNPGVLGDEASFNA
jgi:SNF2 family DNA or RNA helicase